MTGQPETAVGPTPGPWHVVSQDIANDGQVSLFVESPHTTIARLSIPSRHAEANAQLIAAAPELLGSAKAFLAAMDDDRIRKLCIGLDIDIYTIGARLIDAITKAEGRDS